MTESEEERPAFDEDPPVDPEEPRVGNSKAVFVEPTEDEGSEGEEENDAERDVGSAADEEDAGEDER